MRDLPAFSPTPWQMSTGERIALEGLLAQVSPNLAVEIGTAEGGSLSRIAAHAVEVHSFDLVEPQFDMRFENVTLHTGDSHKLLPAALTHFAEEGRNVDFVLVDGDHSTEGVKQDMEDLLESSAVQQTVIVIHDMNNPVVRAGVEAIDYDSYPKVTLVEHDCVAGYLFKEERLHGELWGGLGLVVVDAGQTGYFGGSALQQRYYPTAEILAQAATRMEGDTQGAQPALAEDLVPAALGEADYLRADVGRLQALTARQQRVIDGMNSSVSWRLTTPLRLAKSLVRAVR